MWGLLYRCTMEGTGSFTAVSSRVRGGNRLLLLLLLVQFRAPSCDLYNRACNKVKLETYFPL